MARLKQIYKTEKTKMTELSMLERLKKEDKIHIPYLWPPGQANPSKKMIYARKVLSGTDTVIIGSSLNIVEPIWEKF